MYFSLITPTPGKERDAAFQWAQGPYADHQWLWRFFKAEPGTPRDFLFRRRDGENSMPGFYVVSSRQLSPAGDAWQVQSKSYEPQLHAGQRFAFSLRANPVISIADNGKSRRNDVVMHEKKKLLRERGYRRWSDWPESDPDKPLLYELVQQTCSAWLERRAEQCGFQMVKNAAGKPHVRVDGYQQHRGLRKGVQFSTVDFEGELEVLEPEAFRMTLWKGIGHAKAFGCGLLLVRPISNGDM